MTRVIGLALAVIGAVGMWWTVMEQGRIIRRSRIANRMWRM